MQDYKNSTNLGMHSYLLSDIPEDAKKEAEASKWLCEIIRNNIKPKIAKDYLCLLLFFAIDVFFCVILIISFTGIKDDPFPLIAKIVLFLMLSFFALLTWSSIGSLRDQYKIYKHPLELDSLKPAIAQGITCSDIYSTFSNPDFDIIALRVGKKCIVQNESIPRVIPVEDVTNISLRASGKYHISFFVSAKSGFQYSETVTIQDVSSLEDADAKLTLLVHRMAAYCPNAKIAVATRTN